MVNIGASIGIKAMMDTSDIERGSGKIKSLFDEITRKGKDMGTFFDRIGSLLLSLTKGAIAFSAALVGALTAGIASSPQFKAFMAELKGPWMKLTSFLGQEFKPIMDKIVEKVKMFVEVFTTNPKVKEFLDMMVDRIGAFLDKITKKDFEDALTTLANLGSKIVTFTFDVAGELWDIIMGDEKTGTKGLLKAIIDLPDTVSKTLGLDLSITGGAVADLTARALLAMAAWKLGGPLLGIPVTAALLGQGMQELAGNPEAPGYKPRTEETSIFTDLARIFDNIMTLMTGRNKPLHPGYGSIEGETGYENYPGYNTGVAYSQNITIILENKTGTGVRASTTTPNASVQLN